MSKKLTITKLKMADIGNNMMEAGAELYKNPRIKKEIKNKLENKKEHK